MSFLKFNPHMKSSVSVSGFKVLLAIYILNKLFTEVFHNIDYYIIFKSRFFKIIILIE